MCCRWICSAIVLNNGLLREYPLLLASRIHWTNACFSPFDNYFASLVSARDFGPFFLAYRVGLKILSAFATTLIDLNFFLWKSFRAVLICSLYRSAFWLRLCIVISSMGENALIIVQIQNFCIVMPFVSFCHSLRYIEWVGLDCFGNLKLYEYI